MNGGRRRREAALQYLEGETHVVLPLAVARAVGSVHLLPDIGGNSLVQVGLGRREFVACRVSPALGKKGRTVEMIQLLLRQAAHHVRHVSLMDTLTEAALEPIGVEQPHEELEVRLLAVVGRCRHQEKIACPPAQELPELMALRLLHLTAKIGGRHAMGLVTDHQIPFGRGQKLGLQVVRACRHV